MLIQTAAFKRVGLIWKAAIDSIPAERGRLALSLRPWTLMDFGVQKVSVPDPRMIWESNFHVEAHKGVQCTSTKQRDCYTISPVAKHVQIKCRTLLILGISKFKVLSWHHFFQCSQALSTCRLFAVLQPMKKPGVKCSQMVHGCEDLLWSQESSRMLRSEVSQYVHEILMIASLARITNIPKICGWTSAFSAGYPLDDVATPAVPDTTGSGTAGSTGTPGAVGVAASSDVKIRITCLIYIFESHQYILAVLYAFILLHSCIRTYMGAHSAFLVPWYGPPHTQY